MPLEQCWGNVCLTSAWSVFSHTLDGMPVNDASNVYWVSVQWVDSTISYWAYKTFSSAKRHNSLFQMGVYYPWYPVCYTALGCLKFLIHVPVLQLSLDIIIKSSYLKTAAHVLLHVGCSRQLNNVIHSQATLTKWHLSNKDRIIWQQVVCI